jgi:hypothetical protein
MERTEAVGIVLFHLHKKWFYLTGRGYTLLILSFVFTLRKFKLFYKAPLYS